jgi:hypothetical protein
MGLQCRERIRELVQECREQLLSQRGITAGAG